MERKDWERQPKESPRAYQYFEVYRDLGVSRSVSKVYQKCIDEGRKVNKSYLLRLSQRYQWVQRAAAWDDYQAQLAAQQREKEYQERIARLAEYGQLLQQKACAAVREMPLGRLSPQDILRWLEFGIDLEERYLPRPDAGEADYWNDPIIWRLVDAAEENLP